MNAARPPAALPPQRPEAMNLAGVVTTARK
jgi:hypothetical protein